MRMLIAAIVALAAALAAGLPADRASAADAIGAVSRMQGEASGLIGDANQALAEGASVFLNEVVSTGAEARLEVTFVDGTAVTLGERAAMTLDTFVFQPAESVSKVRLGVTGAFRFVSGQASKLANADVAVATPVATAGIRGTDFWAGPIDGQALGVLVLEGQVSVTNPAGQALLGPGQGTNIATPDAAPGPVTIWPQDKVARALAATTFQ